MTDHIVLFDIAEIECSCGVVSLIGKVESCVRRQLNTKNGQKDILDCIVSDKTGRIKIKMWSYEFIPQKGSAYFFGLCSPNEYQGIVELNFNEGSLIREAELPDTCPNIMNETLNFITDPKEYSFLRKLINHGFTGFLHETAFENIRSILRSRCLVSRNIALVEFPRFVDNANQNVISGTSDDVRDCVRFYLRPRTPTNVIFEKNNVGDNPNECTVAYLRFKWETCHISGARITSGNARTICTREWNIMDYISRSIDEIDLDKVFDFTPPINKGDEVPNKNERHAELLIPDRVYIDFLDCIVVKNRASYDLLLKIIGPVLADRYKNMISIDQSYYV